MSGAKGQLKFRNIGKIQPRIATVGSEMVQIGCLASRWDPDGPIPKHLLKRDSQDDTSFQPLIDKELLYSGREGDVLHIN